MGETAANEPDQRVFLLGADGPATLAVALRTLRDADRFEIR